MAPQTLIHFLTFYQIRSDGSDWSVPKTCLPSSKQYPPSAPNPISITRMLNSMFTGVW